MSLAPIFVIPSEVEGSPEQSKTLAAPSPPVVREVPRLRFASLGMTVRTLVLFIASGSFPFAVSAEDSAAQRLIPWLLDESNSFKGILFSEVVEATSGKKIIPFDRDNADDARILAGVGQAMDEVLSKMNAPESEVHRIARINEVSGHFENLMQKLLNGMPDFSCDFPRTKSGQVLRSGYPDLRLVDKPSGKICYLDPKLYAEGSRESSFRTFYFEPKKETNKVNDDARHLIVGIAHARDSKGWKFLRWELIDLAHFRVKLKAEFEGSNRDMYRRDAVVGTGPAVP